MNAKTPRKHTTISACGLDCALCPRYYTKGVSRCPGCGAKEFFERGMSCGHLSCCVKRGIEVCAQCDEYPCERFEAPGLLRDSFISHQAILPNNERIRSRGLESFLATQQKRIEGLEYLLNHVDVGRSKSFYCICAALLPLGNLENLVGYAQEKEVEVTQAGFDQKDLDKAVRARATEIADELDISLKLNTA